MPGILGGIAGAIAAAYASADKYGYDGWVISQFRFHVGGGGGGGAGGGAGGGGKKEKEVQISGKFFILSETWTERILCEQNSVLPKDRNTITVRN